MYLVCLFLSIWPFRSPEGQPSVHFEVFSFLSLAAHVIQVRRRKFNRALIFVILVLFFYSPGLTWANNHPRSAFSAEQKYENLLKTCTFCDVSNKDFNVLYWYLTNALLCIIVRLSGVEVKCFFFTNKNLKGLG